MLNNIRCSLAHWLEDLAYKIHPWDDETSYGMPEEEEIADELAKIEPEHYSKPIIKGYDHSKETNY